MIFLFVCECVCCFFVYVFFFFQAEDGIRDLVRSRGLGDVYKRQSPYIEFRSSLGAPGGCGAIRPVRVAALNGHQVTLTPAATLQLSLIHI